MRKTLKIPKKVQLPSNAKKIFNPVLFWDVASADLKKHAKFIISRVLDFGDSKDLKTLRSIYSDDKLIQVIKTRRGLLPKTAHYWSTYFKIPRKDIACLKKF